MTYTLKDIAIVVLNWNGQQLLEKFLPSVIEHSVGTSIYVIDNASSDDSISFLQRQYPNIKTIINEENYGFAGGYNKGLKHVKQPILCLLNNDIEVTKGWLQPILNSFNTDETNAIIQPKILDYKKRTHYEYAGAAGGFIDKYGYPFCRGRLFDALEKDEGQYNDEQNIFWASGACFFIKSSLFKQLNGFDESFFAHMEEIDLCWRTFNNNHKIIYNGKSTVYHLGGGTLKTSNPKKTFLNFRNSLLTLTKNTGGAVLFLIFIRLMLDGVGGFRFLLKGQTSHFIAVLKAHFSYYKNLPKALKFRKLQNKKRKDYYKTKSVIWAYFIQNKKTFKEL